MLKKLMFVLFFLLTLISFAGCSGEYGYESDLDDNDDVVVLADATTPDRLIIYSVTMSFDVSDLDEAATFLDTLMADDEWFDQEIKTTTKYSYVIRIKTDRLDAFIESLQDEYVLRTYEKTGTDISLEYQDTSNQILALEAQMARLLDLYESASLSDMIIINEQISEVEVELQQLNGELAIYDSLVEYSVVTLSFYGSSITTQSPFFNRLGNAFVDGFNALIDFLDGFMIVMATIFPFLFVMGVGVLAVYIVVKKKVFWKKPRNNSDEGQKE